MSDSYSRKSYQQIKALALDAYYDFARDHGVKLGRPHEQVLGAVSYDLDNVFKEPLERLMAAVVQLVLNGGWFPGPAQYYRTEVARELADADIQAMLGGLPQDESSVFLHDLQILGFSV